MKFIHFSCLSFLFFLTNPLISDTILTKSEIIKKSNDCLKDSQNQVCRKLILQMEQMQLVEFEQNRFKCQTSILGLQTEIVESHYFKKIYKKRDRIMSQYVIKNC